MRALILAITLLGAATAASSAFALNPQPLPPGNHAHGGPHSFEPPDPCLQFHRRTALARCRAEHSHAGHPRPMNEGWERDRGHRGY